MKSSFCQDGGCVDVTILESGVVMVEDTLMNTAFYDEDEWEAFIAGVKNGEFDYAKLRKDHDVANRKFMPGTREG
jgi:hypothetical protein